MFIGFPSSTAKFSWSSGTWKIFKLEKLTKTTISKTKVVDSNLSSGMSKIEYKNFLRFSTQCKRWNSSFQDRISTLNQPITACCCSISRNSSCLKLNALWNESHECIYMHFINRVRIVMHQYYGYCWPIKFGYFAFRLFPVCSSWWNFFFFSVIFSCNTCQFYVTNHLAPSFEGENFVSQNQKEETPIDQH